MKIILNPDSEKVEEIRKAIKDNDGYCPCSLIKNESTKCMCEEFIESKEIGYCHCELFQKVNS